MNTPYRLLRNALDRPRGANPWGLARVSFLFFVVGSVSLFFSMRHAHGRAEDALLRMGELAVQDAAPLRGTTRRILINGQQMFISSKLVDMSVDEALDEFQQYCDSNSGGLREAFLELPEDKREEMVAQMPEFYRDPAHWSTARSDLTSPRDEKAKMACLAHPDDEEGFEAAMRRALRFVETGDLGELGDARLIQARWDPVAEKTHIVSIWTQGRFNIEQMLPVDGEDVPGIDPQGTPRPPQAVRVLNAVAEDVPYAAFAYDSDLEPPQVLQFYDEVMLEAGWQRRPCAIDPEDPKQARFIETPPDRRIYMKGSLTSIIALGAGSKDKTGVTIVEMRTVGPSKAPITAPNPF